ncbi:IMP dehydrogenase [Wohlfahrtiimonas chitiniclastica]|uniref:Inosine-5'-monophosphate dehydrogenase n=2 Tax=Wohlfahrtiimonas chitiniclastica TaxID=400946 RepID=L8Y1P9_9GAMM|nr:IMP dehydrogenase [Wohlfahrtiimonas chitiniclastica]ELV08959.1 Inosine-5'-monophosphate dehydrogenase [Wohlfahrtiimonas chitiniclastica SH04]MBS7815602.1 IMP dehydrogenase [Wohlfahrtiimonas chitiniclastica]MBS7817679.1 IMP dehydrogenase [Wohlfahrtiimonas chitiniclastica]MBS7819569.1 IMP dehydrogenase [Wohlfahrtiimonas chitiniclastica]MBS7823483.1 IMP dehydrogenase [Wohlfahrtiimonas chitiniclastica]
MLRIIEQALTFDDVLLVPGYSEVLPKDVSLKTQLTKSISLNIPLLSAAMDTVTESRLAIAMAQQGGIGIVHKNLTIEEQAAEVRKVKKFENGIISDPVTVTPDMTLAELRHMFTTFEISSAPVIDAGKVMGIVTNRDVRFHDNLAIRVKDVMTPRDRLITVKEHTSREEIVDLLQQHRVERLVIVNDNNELRGLVTVKDISRSQSFPNACVDANEQLRVGAAVGAGAGTEERIEALAAAGVDVIIIDTAHGHSKGVIDRVRWTKERYPHIQIVAGNIATADAAIALAEAGADAVKVGIGPGSICTTRIIAGIGVPQISAIANVAEALKGRNIPVIADGGVRYSGDMVKALAAGASCIMVGGLLAGTDEAPGDIEFYQGRAYKSYRGMGSLGAMGAGSSDRYFQEGTTSDKLVPEGIEGRVAYKGSLVPIVHQLMGGIRAGMGYVGCGTIAEMNVKPQFVQITNAGMRESHVHDVTITKEAPNYSS